MLLVMIKTLYTNCPKIIKIKRSGLLLYLEQTLLFQNIRLYVEKTCPKMQHLFLYTAKQRPKDPSSVFPDIPASCLRSAQKSIARITKRSLSSTRKHAEDEMKIFFEQDKLDFGKFIDQASEKFNFVTLYSHEVGSVSIQSKATIHVVSHFIIQIKNDYSYTCFSFGSPSNVVSLKSTSISHGKAWSAVSEMIRYLSELEMTHKKKILFDQLFVTDKKEGN